MNIETYEKGRELIQANSPDFPGFLASNLDSNPTTMDRAGYFQDRFVDAEIEDKLMTWLEICALQLGNPATSAFDDWVRQLQSVYKHVGRAGGILFLFWLLMGGL